MKLIKNIIMLACGLLIGLAFVMLFK